MGIRVHKDIGYYLKKRAISKILVSDFDTRIDKNYTMSKASVKRIIQQVKELAEAYTDLDSVYPVVQLKELLNKEHICSDQFVKQINDYDTFKGLLFVTPQLASYSRYDDLMDYYEEYCTPKFKLNLLKQSLYPDNFYVCVKVPPLTDKSSAHYPETRHDSKNLEVGHSLMQTDMRWLMISNKEKFDFDKPNLWAYPEKGGEKYFHPYVNIITYAFAKEIGILKPNVTYLDFIQYLEPAIVTHWG